MATVTFFHAHPDDEAIATGGTMASLAARATGWCWSRPPAASWARCPTACSSRGESLAERRAAELAARPPRPRCGPPDLFLGYHDSGMEGEDSNGRADCLRHRRPGRGGGPSGRHPGRGGVRRPRRLRRARRVRAPRPRPGARVGMAAAELAGTPVVYMATMDRGFMLELCAAQAAESELGPDDNLEGADTMGEPSERHHHRGRRRPVDRAPSGPPCAAHASQITEDSFFLAMPDDVFAEVWGQEWFIRVRPDPAGLGDGVREPGLVVEAAGGGDDGVPVRRRQRDGAVAMTRHRVLRVHGGRLVVAERRVELEAELDAAGRRGVHHRELVRRRRQRLPGAGRR